jgi:NAD(P)-dependent dehydrogenase (short-subunit alcohol dehydrogenase family)
MNAPVWEDKDRYEKLIASIPVGRFGEAVEVAEALRFIMSAGASFITGQILTVDGRITIA